MRNQLKKKKKYVYIGGVTVRREMVQIPSLYPGDLVDHLRTTAYEEY